MESGKCKEKGPGSFKDESKDLEGLLQKVQELKHQLTGAARGCRALGETYLEQFGEANKKVGQKSKVQLALEAAKLAVAAFEKSWPYVQQTFTLAQSKYDELGQKAEGVVEKLDPEDAAYKIQSVWAQTWAKMCETEPGAQWSQKLEAQCVRPTPPFSNDFTDPSAIGMHPASP